MSNVQDVIKQYNHILEVENNATQRKIDQAKRLTLLYGKLVLAHRDKYKPNIITDYINEVFNQEEILFQYKKSYNLFKGMTLTDYIYANATADTTRIITSYFSSFKKAVFEWMDADDKMQALSFQDIHRKVVIAIFKRYNWHMGTQMLQNGIHYPIGHNLRLRINVKSRDNNLLVGRKRQKVDWGASFKNLKKLLDEQAPELMSKYDNKELNKRQLIDASKTILYNAKDNPDGTKWLIYDDKDIDFWLILKDYNATGKYVRFYGVTPSNYIINETTSQADFLKSVKRKEDIIYSNLLGYRDKIVMLEKYDISHCLMYFRDDL